MALRQPPAGIQTRTPQTGWGRRVCPPTPTPGTRPSGQSRPLTGLPLVGECILHKRHAGRPQGIRNTRPSQLGVPVSASSPRASHPQSRAGAGPKGRPLPASLPPPACPRLGRAIQSLCPALTLGASTPGLVSLRWALRAAGQGCSPVSSPPAPAAWPLQDPGLWASESPSEHQSWPSWQPRGSLHWRTPPPPAD